jgi:hypothetical protein
LYDLINLHLNSNANAHLLSMSRISRGVSGGGGYMQCLSMVLLCAVSLWLGFFLGQSRLSIASAPGVRAGASTVDVGAARTAAVAAPVPTLPALTVADFSVCHRRLSTRGELPSYLDALGLTGDGVEIGVRDGEFSEHTLGNWKGHKGKLHLVDPWLAQDKKLYNDVSNVDQMQQDARFELVSASMLTRFPGRAVVHRKLSVDAARSFADASLDYVYVDARHDYAGALEDLHAWYPKLRSGGLIAGHDFIPDGIKEEGDFGVQRAVSEFALIVEREVQSISDKRPDGGRAEPQNADGGWTTFYWVK